MYSTYHMDLVYVYIYRFINFYRYWNVAWQPHIAKQIPIFTCSVDERDREKMIVNFIFSLFLCFFCEFRSFIFGGFPSHQPTIPTAINRENGRENGLPPSMVWWWQRWLWCDHVDCWIIWLYKRQCQQRVKKYRKPKPNPDKEKKMLTISIKIVDDSLCGAKCVCAPYINCYCPICILPHGHIIVCGWITHQIELWALCIHAESAVFFSSTITVNSFLLAFLCICIVYV